MDVNYPFGKILTEQNYQPLKKLAQKLLYKEFHSSTGFGRGVHNRLRRFPDFKSYRKYTSNNNKKYYPRYHKKAITLRDVYEKLIKIEDLLRKGKK